MDVCNRIPCWRRNCWNALWKRITKDKSNNVYAKKVTKKNVISYILSGKLMLIHLIVRLIKKDIVILNELSSWTIYP